MLGAGSGGQLNVVDTGRTQGIAGSSQGRARGDDIVDDQDRQAMPRLAGAKCRTDQPLGAGLPGLRSAVRSVQQPPAGHPELTGNGAGYCLCLVVATVLHPASAGRCPGDDIDIRELEPADHVYGQQARRRTSVTELERDYQLPRRSLERERSANTLGTAQRTNRRQ
jgi:hypothetical protein